MWNLCSLHLSKIASVFDELDRPAASRSAQEYVFGVTSIGQRSSAWPCKLDERDKLSPRVQAPFSLCTIYGHRQMHWTNLSGSIEAKYLGSWPSFDS